MPEFQPDSRVSLRPGRYRTPPPETACYSGRYSASCQATNTLFFNNLSDSFTHIFAQITHMDECSRVPVGGSDR